MKPYLVTVPVKEVHGSQVFRVMALDSRDALERFVRGEGEDLVHEELEVVSLGYPETALPEGTSHE